MNAGYILDQLQMLYPQARAELRFSNPFETLIATILSAQCTDKRVNQVTESLFRKYPDPASMSALSIPDLEEQIRTCGLYRTKARNIHAVCRTLVDLYDSKVPDNREELMQLPGVGRKTAGVVLMAAFGQQQIPVDTHVFRVSNRIGLAHADTPEETETQLQAVLPEDRWSHAHHLLIWHGRRCCSARKPACERCPLAADGQCEAFMNGHIRVSKG